MEPNGRVETGYNGYPPRYEERPYSGNHQHDVATPYGQSYPPSDSYSQHSGHGGYTVSSPYSSTGYDQQSSNVQEYHNYAAAHDQGKIYQFQKHHDNHYDQNELELIRSFRQRLLNNAVDLHLADANDVKNLLEGPNSLVVRYLNQREHNVDKAVSLAKSVLKWRKSINLNSMQVDPILCDLYGKGLIFEQNVKAQNPIVWIRLGMLSNIIDKLHTAKLPDLSPRTLKNLARGSLKITGNSASTENYLVKTILNAIAWWLNDWDSRNLDAKTILVLDFENSKSIFGNSISVGEFLMKLDDKFPDLFKKVIHFREEPSTTLIDKHITNTVVSKLNRLVQSKITSRVVNDKTLIANRIDELVPMIGTGHLKGESQVPDHVFGKCVSRLYNLPRVCSAMSPHQLGPQQHDLLNAIGNTFTSSCHGGHKPHKSILSHHSHHL